MAGQRSVVSSAKLIAICTLTSRITGLVRDILLAQAFGLAWVQDAFQYAFQVPNLFRRLFGEGAMAAAFVPTFTSTLEEDSRESAWRLLARTLALLTLALTVVIVAIALIIVMIWFLVPGDPEQLAARRLLLALTALMLPFMLTICVLALFASILNCVGSFVPGALMPVLLNICMILAVGWLGPLLHPGDPERQVYVVAAAVVVAGVLQILVIVPILRAYGVRLGWRLDMADPAVRRLLGLVVPVLMGQGVLALGVFLDAQVCVLLTHKTGTASTFSLLGQTFTYPLEEGALSAITYAQRLYHFPLGVLVISLATAALPAFSRLAARQQWDVWTGEVRQTLRLALFEGILAGTLLIVLAVPMIRLLFEYGRFTPEHTLRAGRVLTVYGFGLWAFCAQHIVLRAFYSLRDVRTPLIISALLLPLNVALNIALVWSPTIREAAFAISATATSTLFVVAGLVVLQRRLGTPVVNGALLAAIAKMAMAAVLAAAVLVTVGPAWSRLATGAGGTLPARACDTLGQIVIGGAVFLIAAWLLRLREVNLLLPGRKPKDGPVE